MPSISSLLSLLAVLAITNATPGSHKNDGKTNVIQQNHDGVIIDFAPGWATCSNDNSIKSAKGDSITTAFVNARLDCSIAIENICKAYMRVQSDASHKYKAYKSISS